MSSIPPELEEKAAALESRLREAIQKMLEVRSNETAANAEDDLDMDGITMDGADDADMDMSDLTMTSDESADKAHQDDM